MYHAHVQHPMVSGYMIRGERRNQIMTQLEINMVARQLIRAVWAIVKEPCDCAFCGATNGDNHEQSCSISGAGAIAHELSQYLDEV